MSSTDANSRSASVSVAATDLRKPAVSDARAYRLASIDLLRGLAMVIMALDHVRDFTMRPTTQDPLQNLAVTPELLIFVDSWGLTGSLS